MISKPIRIAVVSDVHLGHPRNPTDRIVDNLNAELNNDRFLSTVDMLVIDGDLFDRILMFASPPARRAGHWIYSLVRRCARLDVKLRVLEGTPSHDRKQSMWFIDCVEKLKKAGQKTPDMRYVETLEIEYLEEYDANILYLPDEYGKDHEDALGQVKALIAEKGLERVDFAFMHGMFEFQMPAGLNIPCHDSAQYLDLVVYLIFIGHIHTPSSYKRIIAQGSFDRLSHNEEEAKGFVRSEVQPNGDYTAEFVENVNAMKFVTINVDDCDLTDALIRIDTRLTNLPDGSFVRVSSTKDHPIQQSLKVLEQRWVTYQWALHVSDKSERIADVLAEPMATHVPVQIDRQNLLSVMYERLAKRNLPNETFNTCLEALKEVKAVVG